MSENYSLGEIAAFLNAELRGDPKADKGLNTLQNAGSNELAFLANEKYVSQLARAVPRRLFSLQAFRGMMSIAGALLILG